MRKFSDRGPQIASELWDCVYKWLWIEQKWATSFHPPTDGQTENINGAMQRYLRDYMDYLKTHWEERLPVSEFARNNADLETTDVSLSFLNYGYHPSIQVDLSPAKEPEDVRAQTLLKNLKERPNVLRLEMARAQDYQQGMINRRRVPEPVFQLVNRV